MEWLGIDVGGAHLKLASPSGYAQSCAFPLWRQPHKLACAIAKLLETAPECSGLAVTMTGELADCYMTREQGVCEILDQLTSVVAAPKVRVYTVEGKWLSVAMAAREAWQVAASNWHALAQLATRYLEPNQDGLLIDIGSTTTDIIPLRKQKILSTSTTDSQRLQTRELVYAGVERTPVCSIVRELPLFGQSCPVMNEWFATVSDAYTWLEHLPEDNQCQDTPDGRPKTKLYAGARLARMVGEDHTTIGSSDIDRIARTILQSQSEQLRRAIQHVYQQYRLSKSIHVILSGHGDFLIEESLNGFDWIFQRTHLNQLLSPKIARCAPAYAVSVLATEQITE